MKKTAVITIALAFLVGVGSGVFFTYHYLARFMLHNLYVDSAAQANAYAAILKAQKTGNYSHAMYLTAQFLKSEVIILNSCKQDLCKGKSIPEVAKALAAVKEEAVQSEHNSP